MAFDYKKNKDKLFDSTGRALTTGLFEELARPDASIKPLFSLSDWKEQYIDIADPTEYLAAMKLLGNWDHWLVLRRNQSLEAIFDEWKREVEVKLRAEAVQELRKQSRGTKGAMAAKWLAEAGFAARDKRNPKDKKEDESVQSAVRRKLEEDAKRMGL